MAPKQPAVLAILWVCVLGGLGVVSATVNETTLTANHVNSTVSNESYSDRLSSSSDEDADIDRDELVLPPPPDRTHRLKNIVLSGKQNPVIAHPPPHRPYPRLHTLSDELLRHKHFGRERTKMELPNANTPPNATHVRTSVQQTTDAYGLSVSAPLPAILPSHGVASTALVYDSFCNAPYLRLNGLARKYRDKIFLTTGGHGTKGSVFFERELPVAQGFATSFKFQVTRENPTTKLVFDARRSGEEHAAMAMGHGFAFVIQSQGSDVLGEGGPGMGYHGLYDTIAIEFDTFKDDTTNDGDGAHIAVHWPLIPGAKVSSAHVPGTQSVHCPEFKDGQLHTASIIYTAGVLTVSLQTPSQSTPACTLTVPVPIHRKIRLNRDEAYFGFTGAVGTAYQNYIIYEWRLETAGADLQTSHPSAVATQRCLPGFTSDDCTIGLSSQAMSAICAKQISCSDCNLSMYCCGWCVSERACQSKEDLVSSCSAFRNSTYANSPHRSKVLQARVLSSWEYVCEDKFVLQDAVVPLSAAILMTLVVCLICSEYCIQKCFRGTPNPKPSSQSTSKRANMGFSGQPSSTTDSSDRVYNPSRARAPPSVIKEQHRRKAASRRRRYRLRPAKLVSDLPLISEEEEALMADDDSANDDSRSDSSELSDLAAAPDQL